jgi:hypothetical protein
MNWFKKLALGLLFGGSLVAVIAGASLAAVEQEKRVTGLAKAASLDYCKVIAYSKLMGVALRNPYPPKDCNAPDPLDVQRDVSNAALALGGISIASGGLILLIGRKRPDLLAKVKLENIFSKLGNRQTDWTLNLDPWIS